MQSHLSTICKFMMLVLILFIISSCVTTQPVSLPMATRVLGTASIYLSSNGERLEIIHDSRAYIAIIKLPDGKIYVLPAEYPGLEGRYKDTRMTVLEHDRSVLLWIDGIVSFSGILEK